MTRTDILTTFIKKEHITYIVCRHSLQSVFFTLPVFFGNLGTGIAMSCFNITIGALIGGFILLWKLAVALWYILVTAVRLIKCTV